MLDPDDGVCAAAFMAMSDLVQEAGALRRRCFFFFFFFFFLLAFFGGPSSFIVPPPRLPVGLFLTKKKVPFHCDDWVTLGW